MKPNEIKEKHQELNKNEPFTEKENIQYSKKDQSTIRNIQILNRYTKDKAIELLTRYKTGTKTTLRNLAKKYRRKMEEGYEPKKIRGVVKPKQKTKKLDKNTQKVFQVNRKKTKEFLNNPKNKKFVRYTRIKKGFKKYPDASEYELRYGVNSKQSQKYRERRGLSIRYEGRINK